MVKIHELKSLAADLRKRLKTIDQITGKFAERDRDARRKREVRAAGKEVHVPDCQNPARRIEPAVCPRRAPAIFFRYAP